MWFLSFIPDSVLVYLFGGMIVVGAAGMFASWFARFLPPIRLYALPIKIVSAVVFLAGIFFMGGYGVEMSWRAEAERLKQEIAKKEEDSKEATTKIVTKYVDRVKIVKETSDVQIKAIPQLVSKSSDDRCVVPVGFGVLHDAAAKNEIPDTSGTTNEAPSGVKLSEVAETVVGNYSVCTQNAEQLTALQEWIRAQQKIYND
jgi:hypothetical protein